jgi:hypothetical protein
MELSPSWEAANYAATQALRSILWNPEVHHRVHKSPPPVPILSQIDPIHTIPTYLSKIHFNIYYAKTIPIPKIHMQIQNSIKLCGTVMNLQNQFCQWIVKVPNLTAKIKICKPSMCIQRVIENTCTPQFESWLVHSLYPDWCFLWYLTVPPAKIHD